MSWIPAATTKGGALRDKVATFSIVAFEPETASLGRIRKKPAREIDPHHGSGSFSYKMVFSQYNLGPFHSLLSIPFSIAQAFPQRLGFLDALRSPRIEPLPTTL
jgi:hypothetical protein